MKRTSYKVITAVVLFLVFITVVAYTFMYVKEEKLRVKSAGELDIFTNIVKMEAMEQILTNIDESYLPKRVVTWEDDMENINTINKLLESSDNSVKVDNNLISMLPANVERELAYIIMKDDVGSGYIIKTLEYSDPIEVRAEVVMNNNKPVGVTVTKDR